jgi:hypothetical protein
MRFRHNGGATRNPINVKLKPSIGSMMSERGWTGDETLGVQTRTLQIRARNSLPVLFLGQADWFMYSCGEKVPRQESCSAAK